MPSVSIWLEDFAMQLVQRSGRLDWAPGGSEFWTDFGRALADIRATFAEADEASRRACNQPRMFVSDYRAFILAEVPKIRREPARPDLGPGAPATREDADAASRGCPECDGRGISARYVHAEILGVLRSARGSDLPIGASASLWCGSCPLGRFLAAANAAPGKPPRTWADSEIGGAEKYRHHPRDWDDRHDCPARAEGPRPGEPAGDFVRRLRASLEPSRTPQAPVYRDAPRTPHHGDARALPGPSRPRTDLPAETDDPVILAELAPPPPARSARPAPPAPAPIDDDLGWF